MSTRFVRIALGILVFSFPNVAVSQGNRGAVDAAATAMGIANLNTIEYTGSGFSFVFAQAGAPGRPWPRFSARNYVRRIDFNAPASHTQFVRTSLDKKGGGGTGLPIVDQTQNQFVLPNAPWIQQVDIWLTAPGFLKAAIKHNVDTRSERINGNNYTVVSFTDTKYTVRGYINSQNLVEKVQTWIEHPAAGDLLIEANYSEYKDFGGVKFPTKIVQSQGGFPVLDLRVNEVKPNAPVSIQAPQRGGIGAAGQGVTVRSIKAAEGIFYLLGGRGDFLSSGRPEQQRHRRIQGLFRHD
jgi:hypothetical protein